MPEINCKRLAQHLKRIADDWKENREETWGSADAILIAQGKLADMDNLKIAALQNYLLGYEFSNLVFIITKSDLFVLVSKKRADKYLSSLEEEVAAADLGLAFHMLYDKKDNNTESYAAISKSVKASYNGRLLGTLEKEKDFFNTGKLVPPLLLHLEAQAVAYVDIRKPIAGVFAIKDEDELLTIKRAAQLTAKIFQKVVKPELLDVAQNSKKVTHRNFGSSIDAIVENLGSKPELLGKMNAEELEVSYPTMLRTGADAGDAFKIGMENSASEVTFDIALVSLGIRYLNYNSCVSRTLIFHGSRYQVDCYQVLLEAFDAGMQAIVPGKPVKSIYSAVKSFLATSPIPELANYLPKFVGHSMGIERNESLRISEKNNTIITPGMVFYLYVNLEGVPHPKKSGKEGAISLPKFTLILGDTVHVLKDQNPETDRYSASLTRGANPSVTHMVFKGNDDSDSDNEDEAGTDIKLSLAERTQRAAATAGSAGISEEAQIEERQRALMIQKKAEYEARAKKGESRIPTMDEITAQMRQFSAVSEYPRRARALKVYLDTDRETVFIPINQVPVPFHISTIKTVSISDMGSTCALRFNFHTTSQKTLSKDASRNMVNLCKRARDLSFIKEISVKSRNPANLRAQCKQIKEMQKVNRQMMKQALEESNLVKQERVRLITNPPKLQDLQMRPTIRGRRTTGTLECHQNGFRFRSTNAGERLEFTFANIRHAFFQPCKKELTVLIHFHLKNPIMVGKKKAIDIQFFTEVIKGTIAIQTKSDMYDPEEVDEERRERKLRKRLNDLFDTFVKKCEKLVESVGEEKLQFDIPYRDLGFDGVPHKSTCYMMPTKGALVNLTEVPVFVCSLELVDHVHLQRVSFKSKHFEMMIIWKDWERPPAEINMIDRKNLDDIKRWLNEIPISFTQGAEVLNAKTVMKTAKQYLAEGVFFEPLDTDQNPKGIGWLFLVPTEDGDEDGDESDEGSVFSEADIESDEDDDDDEESFDMTDEDEESEDWEESDDGEDWEEMEKKAAEEDRKKSRKHDEYEARVKAKDEAAQRQSSKRKRR